MSSQEFRAWLSSFSQSIDSVPNEDQWALVLKRASFINGDPPVMSPVVTERPVFIQKSWYPSWAATYLYDEALQSVLKTGSSESVFIENASAIGSIEASMMS